MNLPTLRQLEYLVAVAEELSFRRAAERCHVSQPALSAQIQQLEESLGVLLFERDKRHVLTTEIGLDLADRARRLLSGARDLVEVAQCGGRPLQGPLSLGVIPSVAPYLLPTALPLVRERFPDLRLLLHEGQTAAIVERVQRGELDLAVLALEAELGDLETAALFEDPFWVAMPRGHRLARRKQLSERDLVSESVLLLDDGHCLRDQALSWCRRAQVGEWANYRASSLGTLAGTVEGGIGLTLLPALSLSVEARSRPDLVVTPFRSGGPGRTIGLAWRSTSPRAAEFALMGEAIGVAARLVLARSQEEAAH